MQGFVFVLGINDKENYVLLNDFGVAVVVGEFIAAFNRFNGDKAFFFALFVLDLEFSVHVAFDDFVFGFFGDVFDFHFERYFGFAVFVFDFKLEFAYLLAVFVDFVFVFDFLSAVFNFYGLFNLDVVQGIRLAFGGEFDGSFFFVAFGFDFFLPLTSNSLSSKTITPDKVVDTSVSSTPSSISVSVTVFTSL